MKLAIHNNHLGGEIGEHIFYANFFHEIFFFGNWRKIMRIYLPTKTLCLLQKLFYAKKAFSRQKVCLRQKTFLRQKAAFFRVKKVLASKSF